MFANVHQEIDLKQGLPTIDLIKKNFDDFTIDIHITTDEFIVLFKNYVRNNLDIEELERNDPKELLYLLEEFKYHFGRSIFEIRAVINLNILFRKMFSNCDCYTFTKEGMLNISYNLTNISQNDINNYNNLEEE